MFYYIFVFLTVASCVVCDEQDCVTYDFESNFNETFFSDQCEGSWDLKKYSDFEEIEKPHEQSTVFIAPSADISCTSSSTFTIHRDGILEISVYYILQSDNDLLQVLVNQKQQNGRDIIVGMKIINDNASNGWTLLRIELTGADSYDGYFKIFGKASSGSYIAVDSFKYESPFLTEEQSLCEVYESSSADEDGPITPTSTTSTGGETMTQSTSVSEESPATPTITISTDEGITAQSTSAPEESSTTPTITAPSEGETTAQSTSVHEESPTTPTITTSTDEEITAQSTSAPEESSTTPTITTPSEGETTAQSTSVHEESPTTTTITTSTDEEITAQSTSAPEESSTTPTITTPSEGETTAQSTSVPEENPTTSTITTSTEEETTTQSTSAPEESSTTPTITAPSEEETTAQSTSAPEESSTTPTITTSTEEETMTQSTSAPEESPTTSIITSPTEGETTTQTTSAPEESPTTPTITAPTEGETTTQTTSAPEESPTSPTITTLTEGETMVQSTSAPEESPTTPTTSLLTEEETTTQTTSAPEISPTTPTTTTSTEGETTTQSTSVPEESPTTPTITTSTKGETTTLTTSAPEESPTTSTVTASTEEETMTQSTSAPEASPTTPTITTSTEEEIMAQSTLASEESLTTPTIAISTEGETTTLTTSALEESPITPNITLPPEEETTTQSTSVPEESPITPTITTSTEVETTTLTTSAPEESTTTPTITAPTEGDITSQSSSTTTESADTTTESSDLQYCVTFNFEDGIQSFGATGVCSRTNMDAFARRPYASFGLNSPHDLSTVYLAPTFRLSCIASSPFTMHANGVLQVHVYLQSLTSTDYLTVTVFQKVSPTVDQNVGSITTNRFDYGWNLFNISLTGDAAYEGYVAFLGRVGIKSIALIDSFLYIPPSSSVDESSCAAYDKPLAVTFTTDPSVDITTSEPEETLGCVVYHFGQDFNTMFTTEGVCRLFRNWEFRNYASLKIESPNAESVSCIVPSSASTSCTSSFVFPMSATGVVEVKIYMEPMVASDQVEVIVHQINEHGSNPIVGRASTGRQYGWATVKVELGGSGDFNGQITIMGRASIRSFFVVDHFRYIPPSVDEQLCPVYSEVIN